MNLDAKERLALAVLRRFCHDPGAVPPDDAPGDYSPGTALATLERVDPALLESLRGKTVVDFGCGHGHQSAAFFEKGAAQVLCLETSTHRLENTRDLCRRLGFEDRAIFAARIAPDMKGKYDFVISQDAMEHYGDPAAILSAMRSLLKPGGQALVTFGPPWYAPYGAHHRFFSSLPWAHLFFGERVMMTARSAYRSDGCTRYSDVEGGLNQMSLRKFESLVGQSGFRVLWKRYETVKRIPVLGSLPYVRELFVNHVTARLGAP